MAKPKHQPARARRDARLLADVARALNACQAAGLPVKLRHGIVTTPVGYVLPLAGDRWGARTLTYTEFPVSLDGDTGDD